MLPFRDAVSISILSIKFIPHKHPAPVTEDLQQVLVVHPPFGPTSPQRKWVYISIRNNTFTNPLFTI